MNSYYSLLHAQTTSSNLGLINDHFSNTTLSSDDSRLSLTCGTNPLNAIGVYQALGTALDSMTLDYQNIPHQWTHNYWGILLTIESLLPGSTPLPLQEMSYLIDSLAVEMIDISPITECEGILFEKGGLQPEGRFAIKATPTAGVAGAGDQTVEPIKQVEDDRSPRDIIYTPGQYLYGYTVNQVMRAVIGSAVQVVNIGGDPFGLIPDFNNDFPDVGLRLFVHKATGEGYIKRMDAVIAIVSLIWREKYWLEQGGQFREASFSIKRGRKVVAKGRLMGSQGAAEDVVQTF